MDTLEEEEASKTRANARDRKARFDGTINLGHLLTACAMLIGGMTVWNQSLVIQAKQDVRMEAIEKTASRQQTILEQQTQTQYQAVIAQTRLATQLETFLQGQRKSP